MWYSYVSSVNTERVAYIIHTYNCKYCGKGFKHYQSRYKHEKFRCPKKEINVKT